MIWGSDIKPKKNPKYLFRSDDGVRFTRQSDGLYTMDDSYMDEIIRHRYSYDVLMSHRFVTRLRDCRITKTIQYNDGHGNGDFDE